ncbi:hypothetical protein PPROV_000782200 [Pycnococcus provasolii]|uniref:Uncharacterized protein n=1 Tax=Pycnococcus provasolii TaxID=41880 RepID=A0A830HQX1_9CHLO|nr:hypothetical protein PPROV_000782200 [Pycnococcus provasolii]
MATDLVANRRVRENKKKVSKNKNYYDRSCLAPESMRGQYDDNGVCVVHFLFVCLFILCLCAIAVLIGVRISASAGRGGRGRGGGIRVRAAEWIPSGATP